MRTRAVVIPQEQRRHVSRLLFLPAILGLAFSASLLAQPAISFEEKAVIARSLPPGGQALIFGIAREPQGFFTRVVRRQEVVTVDAAGEARLDLGRAIPEKSIWLAADILSGAFRIAAPQRSPAREILSPANLVEAAAAGRVGRLRSIFGFSEILYIRPGRGAWGLTVGDGGEADDDPLAHSIASSLDRLVAIGQASPPPTDFAAGDILIVVDPRGLQIYAARLPAGVSGS